MSKRNRRLLIIMGFLVCLAAYVYFAGCSNSPQIKRIDVVLRDLPAKMDGTTIAQLSDPHFKPPLDLYDKVAERVNARNPDIIVITGDFLDTAGYADKCFEFLARLKAKHGKYAICGNWERWSVMPDKEFRAGVENAGFTLLVNQNVRVNLPTGKLWLAGVDDPFLHRDKLDDAHAGIPAGEPMLLLAHAPNIIDKAKEKGISLVLTGHTHGGQARLPLIGPLYVPEPEFRKYSLGMYREGGTRMYVNAGLGVSTIKYRFFCRPEITVITLRSK